MSNKPRILYLDIETAPSIAAIWSLYNNYLSPDMLQGEWYILCYAAKWEGEDEVFYDAAWNYPRFWRTDDRKDGGVVETLWQLLDEADVVIAHNGRKFDVKKINTRLITLGHTPPSPFRTIDTFLIAKSKFAFSSNKLDYIAKVLKIGEKLSHEGIKMWFRCMAGDPEAQAKMIDYNIRDIDVLVGVYKKLRPWASAVPNLASYQDAEVHACPICMSTNVKKRGVLRGGVHPYQRYRCNDCGAWSQDRYTLAPRKSRRMLLKPSTSNN